MSTFRKPNKETQMSAGGSAVKVAVRCRPLNDRQASTANSPLCVLVLTKRLGTYI